MYYHVWFVTKYRKPILKGKIEEDIKRYFEEIVVRKKYNLLELETSIDHVHMLVEAKDRNDLSAAIRTLKAVSARKIFETPHLRVGNGANLKRNFWSRRYGYREIDFGELQSIKQYIRNQKNLHKFCQM